MLLRKVLLWQVFVLLLLSFRLAQAQTTLSTLNFPDPHVGAALTTDDFGHISDLRVGTKEGDAYTEVQWVDYLTKFVILNDEAPVEIASGSANLAVWDNNPAAPVADGYFIPARFETWTYDQVNSPAAWHTVLEYENGGDHIIGGIGYQLQDPGALLGFPYAEFIPAYQFTNVGAANATLKTIHYERNAQVGNSVYSNHGGNQWDYDNADGTSDDFVAVSSAASSLPYLSFAGFPLSGYRIQSSAQDLLNELQTAGANYNLNNSTNMVLGSAVEIAYQVSEITLAPGEAVLYWLFPKPIKIINTADEYPLDIDYEKKSVSSTGVDYVFADTDVSINYSGLGFRTNGNSVTASATSTTVAEITGGIVPGNVSGSIDHVSTVRYWEIFYDTRRESSVADITFTYDPAGDSITDEDSLILAYRTDYSQDWTEWIGVVRDKDNNTLTANSVHLGDSQWILATTNGDDPLPVELVTFAASSVDQDVRLRWSTATETNNYGFDVERFQASQSWRKIGFVTGHGTTTTPQNYAFVDSELPAGTYHYRLKQIDLDGAFTYSDEITVPVTTPSEFTLRQNYPNPFNPTTIIHYNLPEASHVQLVVYDLLGNEVRHLWNATTPAGYHQIEWDGKNDSGQQVAAGLYFYVIEAGPYRAVRKMLYVR